MSDLIISIIIYINAHFQNCGHVIPSSLCRMLNMKICQRRNIYGLCVSNEKGATHTLKCLACKKKRGNYL